MSEGYIVHALPDNSLTVRHEDANGLVDRHIIPPGTYDATGAWTNTVVTGQPAEVQIAAAITWNAQTIAVYQAAHPYVAPPAATAEQTRVLAILANPRRQALLTAALATDDQGIINYINAQVTDLASAKVMLTNIALILLAVVRS